MKKFEVKESGEIRHFLCITIHQDRKKAMFRLTQQSYLEEVLKSFGVENCNGISTPFENKLKLQQTGRSNYKERS